MMRLAISALVATAVLLAQPALALAQTPEQTFFGPKQYDHAAAGTSFAADIVTVPENATAPFALRVRNGEDRAAVDAAWVFLDGALVASPDDFHPGAREFGRTIQLQPQNRLVVIIRGRARTNLTLAISGEAVLPKVVSLTPVNATVTLGATTALGLTIAPVQTTDTVVPLETTPAGVASVPASVTVPAGQAKVDVPIGTIAFGQAGVTARLNGSSASALVNVVPQSLQVVSVLPSISKMNVGATRQFTVNINAVQAADEEIALSIDTPGILQLPAAVTVPRGATSAVFTATGLAVGDAVVTAFANGTQQTASVHVSPEAAAIVSLLPSPLSLQQGAIGNLRVTTNVAQEADTVIGLANDAPLVVQVPTSVTVLAGSDSALVGVTALAPGSANVTASVNGSSAVAVVDVSPPPPVVTELAPAALTLAKGTPGTLTVKVSRAPSELTTVSLSSSAPGVASVPQAVNILPGTTSADFPVASNGEGQATIRASLNEGSASATVTITPAELAALALSPQTPTLYIGQTVPVTATGTLTDGSTQDFTTRVFWSSSPSATATVDANGVASALAAGTATITASFAFIPSASTQSVTVTGGTLLTVKQPVALALTGPVAMLTGDTTTATIVSSDPAPAGGLFVSLDVTGGAAVPAGVLIPEGATSASFQISAFAPGDVTITANAPNRLPGLLRFTVLPRLQVTAVVPASGAPGALVTLTGVAFDPVPANNQVVFSGGAAAAVISANSVQITVKVPVGAVTGPITVANSRGTAQSGPFTVAPQNAQFTATRAGLNTRSGVSSSPVTPFVQGADFRDAFGFLTLAPPANGTGSVVGNKLVYLSNPGFSGSDSFLYRATAADGSTRDGNALVRVYNSGNLNRCTMTSTIDNTTTPPTVTRTNVLNCAFYGEVQTRISATGAPVTVQYIAVRPSNGSAPKAAVFLIGGGDFDLNFVGNAATGAATTIGANFLVRTAQIFAEAGYLAVAMNKPSDLPTPGTTNTTIDADQYRISVRHAVDILTVLREVNTDGLDVFIAGTSRGGISAVATNLIATGIALSSVVTRASTGPGPLFVNDVRHANLLPGFVQRPSHVLWNTDDQCPLTQPADSQTLANNLGAAFNAVSGGFINDTDVCGAQHFHGYMGIEQIAVDPVTAWLDGRVAALGGNRRPDAAFALLPTAARVPLSIDLAALTRDVDGGPLSYALSHVGSGRGGTVTLSGATATYTPPAGATGGTDNFVYVVTDGRGGVNAAVITIRIGG